ncbi:hypothetical protein [Novosphingobium sp. AP12]|uniref:hypothetical protein n=1 Tax=Novosphingobium sp. AP12 TaxID=1144305 RepID=UPI000271ECB5|nr:hypothetical protein [Novosphingobium sp. AP12]EJL26628.1 hypothetical protein PMI02_02973 [Novosphingobium sp. AP12]
MKFRLMAVGAACTALALTACDNPKEQPKAAAGGELLPRSASDDMLPYDTVRSQASLSAPDAGLFEDAPHSRRPDSMATAVPEEDVVTDPVVPEVAAPVAPTQ